MFTQISDLVGPCYIKIEAKLFNWVQQIIPCTRSTYFKYLYRVSVICFWLAILIYAWSTLIVFLALFCVPIGIILVPQNYKNWIDNPSIRPETFKILHSNIYFCMRSIRIFGFLFFFLGISYSASLIDLFVSINQNDYSNTLIEFIVKTFVFNLFLIASIADVWTGPDQPPPETVWSKAKNKIANMRKPGQLVPLPVRI